jgi:EmrB/QacA subfamily drug resistance transporter
MDQIQDKIYKNRYLILFNVVMMTFMACLDGSIVNVTLPVMAKRLNITNEVVSWVVTAYLITIAATILIFGRLGDIKGKTRVFMAGIVLFTLSSLLCGISTSIYTLIGTRVLQAIGAACTMATSQGIITQIFPGNERGKALGIVGSFVALGSLAGPPLGGFIVSVLSWQFIFLINVPIGIATFAMSMKILPRTAVKSEEKLDAKGAVLFTVTIVSLFGSLIIGEDIGYSNPAIISGFIAAVIAMTIFILVEKKIKVPMLQLSIFGNKLFSLSIFCGFVTFIAISCSNIVQPFYLQDVMKLTPGMTGLIMMTYPLILAVVAPASGHLSDKIGSELLTFLGLLLTSTGLFFMATLNEHSQIWNMVIFIAIMAVGTGLFQSPNNSLIMSTVPRNMLGIAGSINSLIRNLGMVTGIALSTTLLYSGMSKRLGYHASTYVPGRDDAFVYGMRIVYIAAGIICVVGALLTAWRLYGKRTGKQEIYSQ